MKVRDWQDILSEVADKDVEPAGWRAVGGDRSTGVGEELFLAHPAVGVYQLKTYAKDPFTVRGVGSRVARSVDADIDPLLPQEDAGRFAVQTPPESEADIETRADRLESVLETHAASAAEADPDAVFEDLMHALESPAFGPMSFDQYGRPDELDELDDLFEEATDLLDAELTELVDDDDVGRGVY